jgi:Flp pilus assembly protein TadD
MLIKRTFTALVWWPLAASLALAAAFAAGAPSSLVADPGDTNRAAGTLDPEYVAGKQALELKDWGEAAKRLGRAVLRDPDNADLHNDLGFAHRKLGQLDPAFAHYRRALELNPRHRGAHEYAGEAYLMVGNLAKAEEHLAALRGICLLPCDELADLEREIAAYRQKAGATR